MLVDKARSHGSGAKAVDMSTGLAHWDEAGQQDVLIAKVPVSFRFSCPQNSMLEVNSTSILMLPVPLVNRTVDQAIGWIELDPEKDGMLNL